MRRSSGLGSGGGGRMIRAMSRTVGAAKEALATTGGSRTKPAVSVSVSASSPCPQPVSAGWRSVTCLVDGDEWERIGDDEEEEEERLVFGEAPSVEEAEDAVSAIKQIFVPAAFSNFAEDGYPSATKEIKLDKIITTTNLSQGVYSSEPESDWIEPPMHLYASRDSESHERGKVLDAFRLLQTNPSVQRMVVALSSDTAVWDAVMKNEVVQEFKKSINEAEDNEPHGSDKDHNILMWILDGTKVKITEFFNKIANVVNDILQPKEKDKHGDIFNDVVRSSFMLSVVVFLIVMATRLGRG